MNILRSMAAVRRAMVSKCCAAALVLLIVLPFTPPFSTCGLSDLMGEAPIDHGPASDGKITPETATAAVVMWSAAPSFLSVAVLASAPTGVVSPRQSRPDVLRL